MELLTLIWEFFKTGLFAVGGGLATLPFLSRMGETYAWFTKEELANMIAVSESTPGPIGVNMATYVGYAHGGVLSAVMATLSLITPSIIVICIIAGMMEKFQNSRIVQDAFSFIRPAVTGLIAAAGWSVFEIALFKGGVSFGTINWLAVAIFAVVLVCTQLKKLKKLHPIVFILAGAILGIIFQM
ncbi:MAG: chromate transporter [Aristaeellaceae bacterium]